MIPQRITFTGLQIDPEELFKPRKTIPPAPANWERVQFSAPAFSDSHVLEKWIEENLEGRYMVYDTGVYEAGQPQFVALFEDAEQAVMFKLKGGDEVLAGESF